METLNGKIKFAGAVAEAKKFEAEVEGVPEYTQLYKHSLTVTHSGTANAKYYYISTSKVPSTAATLASDMFNAICVRDGSQNGVGHVAPYMVSSTLYVAYVQDNSGSIVLTSEGVYASGDEVADVVTKL